MPSYTYLLCDMLFHISVPPGHYFVNILYGSLLVTYPHIYQFVTLWVLIMLLILIWLVFLFSGLLDFMNAAQQHKRQ